MEKWEYCKIDLSGPNPRSDDIEVLNGAGRSGWDLVTITANHVAFLKRRVHAAPAQKTTAQAPKRSAARPG